MRSADDELQEWMDAKAKQQAPAAAVSSSSSAAAALGGRAAGMSDAMAIFASASSLAPSRDNSKKAPSKKAASKESMKNAWSDGLKPGSKNKKPQLNMACIRKDIGPAGWAVLHAPFIKARLPRPMLQDIGPACWATLHAAFSPEARVSTAAKVPPSKGQMARALGSTMDGLVGSGKEFEAAKAKASQ